jgi:hypothetical protein
MTITTEQLNKIGNALNHVEHYPTVESVHTDLVAATESVLTFTTRDEYLAWVASWKDQYRELTKAIRQAKNSRKLSSPTYDPSARDNARLWGWHARTLLHIRQQGKSKSWQMRNERRAKEQAAKA